MRYGRDISGDPCAVVTQEGLRFGAHDLIPWSQLTAWVRLAEYSRWVSPRGVVESVYGRLQQRATDYRLQGDAAYRYRELDDASRSEVNECVRWILDGFRPTLENAVQEEWSKARVYGRSHKDACRALCEATDKLLGKRSGPEALRIRELMDRVWEDPAQVRAAEEDSSPEGSGADKAEGD